ncbi:MAG: hypothetical protein HOV80_26110 [Polyangiaceae bacterium]|nr:hypothetical protein [Polyangiaceae bacterium]
MRALSLPGCGCRGAFQFAVLARLAADGERFDLVGGASSGSLSGAAWVAGVSIDGPAIYRTLASTPVLSARWLMSEKSPFGMSRIVREALERFIPESRIHASSAELIVSTTRLGAFCRKLLRDGPLPGSTGRVVHSSRERRDFHDILLASCTFPPFYARLYRIDGEAHFDGGVTDNTLIDELVARGATHITVVTPHAAGTVYSRLFEPIAPPAVPRHVQLRVIHPERPLRLKSFDFDPERLDEALSMPHRIQELGSPSATTCSSG